MKNIDKVEKLSCIRNEMTHLWGSIFIVGGGSIALVMNNPSISTYVIGFIGIIFAILFLNAYFVRRVEMFKMLESLEGEK